MSFDPTADKNKVFDAVYAFRLGRLSLLESEFSESKVEKEKEDISEDWSVSREQIARDLAIFTERIDL